MNNDVLAQGFWFEPHFIVVIHDYTIMLHDGPNYAYVPYLLHL